MANKLKTQKKWVSPTETFIKNVDKIVQSGISKEDKQFLLDELAKMLEDWKAKNSMTTPKQKAS